MSSRTTPMTKSTDTEKRERLIEANPDEIPSETDLLWISRIRKLSEDSLKTLEEGAKSIMTGCTLFITVYAFILSEAQDKSRVATNAPLVFAAPLVFLALSMISAVLVVLPLRRYETNEGSVTGAKDAWLDIAGRKYWALWIALIFLTLGLLWLIAALVICLRC